jgi:ABC-type iron transport system FetAB ATPase subunit
MNANLQIIIRGPQGCGKSRMKKKIAEFLRREGFGIVNESEENPCQIELQVPVRENPAQTKLPI